MNNKYHPFSLLIHWLSAFIVIAAFVLGPEDVDEIENPGLDLGLQAHETLGLVVFGLTVLRIIWTLFLKRPAEIHMPPWMRLSAKSLQGALYLLLLVVPLTAIMGTWLEGDALSLLNNITVISPFRKSEHLGEFLLELHPVLADGLLVLAGIHACAGLFHHYVLKDTVLETMLPNWLIQTKNRNVSDEP